MRIPLNMISSRRARSRGIAALLSTLMVLGVMSVVGLAVDVGLMYAVKVKLSSAADAAALATARGLGRGGSSGGPTSDDLSAAYFAANMPNGYLFASTTVPATNIDTSVANIRTVTVQAQATVPTLFLRLLTNQQVINVTASASRRDVNLLMVLDRSGSLAASGSCTPMKQAAQGFINQFTPGRDNIGLVVFGASSYIGYALPSHAVGHIDYTTGSPNLNTQIGNISCGGNTGSAQGLSVAKLMLDQLNQPGAINAIVFFTDGEPNGLSADWPIATQPTPVYPTSSGKNGGPDSTPTAGWYGYGHTTGYPASTCNNTTTVGGIQTLQGVIARNGELQHGIMYMQSQDLNTDGNTVANSNNCAMARGSASPYDTRNLTYQNRVDEDVAYIPTVDAFGNATTGYWDTASGMTNRLITVPPYSGQKMLDYYAAGACGAADCGLYNNNIDLSSMNAAESAATAARSGIALTPANTSSAYFSQAIFGPGGAAALPDTVPVNMKIIVFCIGLGGATDAAPGQFLEHLANTLNSDQHSSHTSDPTGDYIYVTGPNQLGSAFHEIASFVLRLSS
jgi:Flp pilus assembly protein TadG